MKNNLLFAVLCAFTTYANAIVPHTGLVLPLSRINNTGLMSLPIPSGPPRYIALGVGTQNYSCTVDGLKVASTSALAVLFDAKSYLEKNACDMDGLSASYLRAYDYCGGGRYPAQSSKSEECLRQINHALEDLPVLGLHYFNTGNSPSFAFSAPGTNFTIIAAKSGDVQAPRTQDIDWLYLNVTSGQIKGGKSSIYRVETAGGTYRTCLSSNTTHVPYAALYWFY